MTTKLPVTPVGNPKVDPFELPPEAREQETEPEAPPPEDPPVAVSAQGD